jgi:isopentenyl-diphosphate Delta-isomerase
MGDDIQARKDAHLEITASGRGAFTATSTLLEEVRLVHQALPELALEEIDLRIELFGRRLKAPLLVGAMTGGTETAATVNRELAAVAEDLGIGFCLGSQRVMAERPEAARSFRIRDAAPGVLLVGNLGLVQARDLGPEVVAELVASVGADAMAVHLNPAQELTQTHGDRDFRGCLDALRILGRTLSVPLLVKETGCGISREAGRALVEAGVGHVEVSGAGGTSWVRVEAAREPERAWVEALLGEWGIPTAASLLLLEDLPLVRIAGGGLRDALDVARAIALGASACAVAQPVLVAHREGGADGARRYLEGLIDGLRALCLLTGCRTVHDLWQAPRMLGPSLSAWRAAATPAGG